VLAIFPDTADEPPVFGIQVGRIYFGARSCSEPAQSAQGYAFDRSTASADLHITICWSAKLIPTS